MVADVEELDKFGRVRNPCSKTQMPKTSSCRKTVNISSSRSKMEQSKLCGRDQVLRRSTSIQDYSARVEEHNDDLQGESDGSQPLEK